MSFALRDYQTATLDVILKNGEELRAIPGLDGFYSATNLGCIFSHNYRRTRRIHELSQATHPEGYKRVKLFAMNKKSPTPVHRLVAMAFLPNPKNLPQVNHKDGNKGNNVVENLEWCDNAHNQKHAAAHGLHVYPCGEAHAMAVLNEEDVRKIKDELRSTAAYKGQLKEIGERYGVSLHCIFDIKHGRSWRTV